jgi:CRP/FNR family transcriptional regulator, cyclic AMP receptor protein
MATPTTDHFTAVLEPTERVTLTGMGQPRTYRRGAVLMLEGDRSNHVIIIREGRVKVLSTAADGREIVLAVRGPGSILGDSAAMDQSASGRSATVIALETVHARVLRGADFVAFLQAHPKALFAFTQSVAARLHDADRRHVEFGTCEAPKRVARALIEMAEQHGCVTSDGVEIDVALTQDELAGFTAASRESVARALAQLRKRGVLTTGRRTILVRDLEGLRRFGR